MIKGDIFNKKHRRGEKREKHIPKTPLRQTSSPNFYFSENFPQKTHLICISILMKWCFALLLASRRTILNSNPAAAQIWLRSVMHYKLCVHLCAVNVFAFFFCLQLQFMRIICRHWTMKNEHSLKTELFLVDDNEVTRNVRHFNLFATNRANSSNKNNSQRIHTMRYGEWRTQYSLICVIVRCASNRSLFIRFIHICELTDGGGGGCGIRHQHYSHLHIRINILF